ncbi:MAG: hypothetical protein HOU81_27405 [Hamadaea sp.]|uniref:hypothetical protein n=1 Tax=Hamadaea sp. TaxID=2024425 RepID=UPI0018048243|nr:hypothetical protein [Hamadaea sp.]NUR74554.1 hypothetical protein [Hamadaea sp.]NUT20798.1 hypothetical protein [Hamadaea sp.]
MANEKHGRPGPGGTAYALDDRPLFPRLSIVTTTAMDLVQAHVPAGESDPCERCGQPSPCPTAVHAREVVRLSMPRPVAATTVPSMLGLLDEEP